MSAAVPVDVDVLAVGETMVVITPERGARLGADVGHRLRPGGAESNVAVQLAMLGHSTAWASALGSDPLGELILGSLRGHGVDVRLVRRHATLPTGVYFKDPDPAGSAVYYYRAGSAATSLSPADVPAWGAPKARVVHLSGITGALSPPARDLVRHLVLDRPLAPALISFDVNHRPALWRPPGAGPAELLALARHSDVVFVGRDEAAALWGTTSAESVRHLLSEPPYLIVKDAAEEAVAFTPTGTFRVPARPVEVVEPTGAGDAFAAGWLSGLLRGRDETDRLRIAHEVAARVLTSPSDTPERTPE